MSDKKIFVIEHCENCQMHSWNTRHDANKYKANAMGGKFLNYDSQLFLVAAAIKERYPNCEVVFNMVPKVWAMSDIYCQLIPNDDPNNACYEVVPRIGSFEVSLNGVVSFHFEIADFFRIRYK